MPEVVSPASDTFLVCALEPAVCRVLLCSVLVFIHSHAFAGKMYACQYCDAVFAQSIELSRHVRTHTGDKPYVCRDCGKGFRQANGLSIHLHTFHSMYCNCHLRHHRPHLALRKPAILITELSLHQSWAPFWALSFRFCKTRSPLSRVSSQRITVLPASLSHLSPCLFNLPLSV